MVKYRLQAQAALQAATAGQKVELEENEETVDGEEKIEEIDEDAAAAEIEQQQAAAAAVADAQSDGESH